MKRLFVTLSVLLAIFIASPAFADDEYIREEIEFDYLNNGTLYSVFIRHRRPAEGIAETAENRKKKSLAENISYSVYSDFRSRYVSHSLAASNGWVWQPAATVEWYGLGFNVWGNFVLDDIPNQGTFNEIDLTLYYNFEIHGFTIHPYFVSYIYPTSNKRSLDFSASTDLLPSIHLAYSAGPLDIFADVQFYVHPTPGAVRAEFGLGLTHKLPLKFGIQTSAIVGFGNSKYNRSVFTISKNAFNYFTYNIAFPWNPIKGFTVSPNAHVSTFLAQNFRDATQFPVLVWGGIDFAYNF